MDSDVDFLTVIGSATVAEELKSEIEEMKELLEDNKLYWVHTNYPFDYEIIS